ncbi:hypothetical protein TNCV_2193921 [Trichonephila clavipes]|uniref:Uncharacterized protein n=1 Tax=Trichonephila clavipes TaxID=2585209 RepID=A0A8X6SCD1_TRICX|nr:hypothetical protein TNCV_2193921 [Trichonephila clavipes]
MEPSLKTDEIIRPITCQLRLAIFNFENFLLSPPAPTGVKEIIRTPCKVSFGPQDRSYKRLQLGVTQALGPLEFCPRKAEAAGCTLHTTVFPHFRRKKIG